ncbi:MAG: universal stress protein [Myxococcota bacterium]
MAEWMNVKKVVVPVDLSNPSFEAVKAASTITDPNDIRLVHVLAPMTAVEPGVVFGNISDEGRATRVKEAIQQGLADRDLGSMPVDVRVGSPGVTICDYAEEAGADLIVISSHGRSGLRRLLLGSVAETVLRHAPCPVLVLRGDFSGG